MGIPFLESKAKKLENATKDISKQFEVERIDPADCECCSIQYPDTLNIDMDPLYDTAKKIGAQVLVFTGETNWKKDISDEKTVWGAVCAKLTSGSAGLDDLVEDQLRINGCELFDDDLPEDKVALLVFPQFVKVVTDVESCVHDVKKVLSVKPGEQLPSCASPLPDRGFVLLCSHGKRDKRCGITAPLMKKALNIELREAGLYRDYDDDTPDGVRVVFINHVGGHKFAANALIYQNDGMALMLARLRPEYAKTLVEKTILKGIVDPAFVRSCNKVKAYSW